ncbi:MULTISPECIES: hypothetical protein [Cupriavidus]|uniref:Uncharacterized protein n=1 Tax=Cupriavidus oxalaticus TaxID=96344 RepID=A0A4P7LLR9_9BURK|nr:MULTISPECIES: hypothetical protein [Cupriavidus]MBF6990013.1 hypothetical protein [Cupriavidus sp. IK-TO18]QBY55769.1 hypothetical protein E0W60_32925 [Cupriavidus oxalaticus]TDF67430.1 hypothetical protein E1J61_03935 [Cupriavidus sp. L7L]
MIKHLGSAEQIRDEISRRVQENTDLGEAFRDCSIPLPRHVDAATNGGCNWIIDAFPAVPASCLTTVKAVTAEMMREYDLR